MNKLTYTDLHIHSEFSLQDGLIRMVSNNPNEKSEIILSAESRNTGAVTATDHGNMYGHAILAKMAKKYGLKHIPACEFYMATDHRTDKSYTKRGDSYTHINAWAKNKDGYANLCRLQKASYVEGFYYIPRIYKELLEKYHHNIMWSDACVGGTISSHIVNKNIDQAYKEFIYYLDLIKDDFYIEYHNHGIEEERMCNEYKVEWANKHGVPIIACTDSHFFKKEDKESHKALLTIQFNNWLDNPTFGGFPGDGYWILNEEELIERFPIEYLNNTQLIVDKVEGGIIEFGNIKTPKFDVPAWFRGDKQ